MKIFLITTAGGSGTRMGAGKPKQFLELGGKSVLQLTLERLKEGIPDAELITVLPQDQISVWKQMCYDSRFSCRQTLVAGGITRFHSVKNALAKVPDGAIVAVHDGVRPLISPAFVRRLLDEALEFGSAADALRGDHEAYGSENPDSLRGLCGPQPSLRHTDPSVLPFGNAEGRLQAAFRYGFHR